MTYARRKTDNKKQRKVVFRKIKKLISFVAKHAKQYRGSLKNEGKKIQWTHVQALRVAHRIDSILEQLLAEIKQAHGRIIGLN
jgi:hypothetical protein